MTTLEISIPELSEISKKIDRLIEVIERGTPMRASSTTEAANDPIEVTLEELRARFEQLAKKGHRKALKDYLDGTKLPDVPESDYPDLVRFLDELEQGKAA